VGADEEASRLEKNALGDEGTSGKAAKEKKILKGGFESTTC